MATSTALWRIQPAERKGELLDKLATANYVDLKGLWAAFTQRPPGGSSYAEESSDAKVAVLQAFLAKR